MEWAHKRAKLADNLTRPGRYFARNACKYGDDCRFQHNLEAAAASRSTQQRDRRNNNHHGGGKGNQRVSVCHFWRQGRCRYGNDCRFSHMGGQHQGMPMYMPPYGGYYTGMPYGDSQEYMMHEGQPPVPMMHYAPVAYY